jgi:flagellar hook-length control protein FliK
MSTNIPIMQILGSAAGIGGQSSPAAAPAPVGQSVFSGIMGGLVAATTGQGIASGAAGAASSTNSTSGNSSEQSILAALQSGQITPEMIAALNAQQGGGSLAALAAGLAELMSGEGQGRMVPLAAGIDLSQLQAAGIELPEGLTSVAGDGEAMLLVNEDALKSLMTGGGWKDGASVQALLMLGAESDNGQQMAGYLEVNLSMVESSAENGSVPALGFQLNLDPSSNIKMTSDLVAGLAQDANVQADSSPVMKLAGLLARLKDLAVSEMNGQSVADGKGAESVENNNTNNIIDSVLPAAEDGSTVTVDAALSVVGDSVSSVSVDPGLDRPVSQGALPSVEKLTAEIEKLLNTLAARINGDNPASSTNAGAAALNLLAGDAAVSAENGDTRAAGQTLELIGKLGELSNLSDTEKQQVLADLADRLSSLLASAGTGNEQAGLAMSYTPSTERPAEATPLMTATASMASSAGVTAGQLPSLATSGSKTANLTNDSSLQNTAQIVSDTVSATAADPSATQGAGQAANGESGILAAIESAASEAGKLAEKSGAVMTAGVSASDKSTNIRPVVQGLQATENTTLAQQTVAASKVEQSAQVQTASTAPAAVKAATTAIPVSAQAEAGQEPAAANVATVEGKSEGRTDIHRETTGRAESMPASEAGKDGIIAERTASLASSAKAGSDSQQVSVPVSLSSLNKSRRSQSKTQTANAVNAFTGNSQSAAKVAGESNDFMQAFRAAAGEKGVADLVEATLVENKSAGEELLARAEIAEQTAKPGGSQPQVGLRLESAGARQVSPGDQQPLRPAQPVPTVNQDEALERIIGSARLTRAGTTSELTMKLDPDHLGMMRVKMSVDENNVMHARVQVETHEARTLIENNLYRLRESLADQGIKVEKFNVDVRQDQQGNQHQQQASAGNSGEYDQTGRGLNDSTNGNNGGGLVENDGQAETVNQNAASVNKYGYSTLEWVA